VGNNEVILTIISALVGGVGTGVWFWYDKKKDDKAFQVVVNDVKLLDKKINTLDNKQTEHENKFVTEAHTRAIIKEEIKPLKDDMIDVKRKTQETYEGVQHILTEMRIKNAVEEARQEILKG